VARPNLITGQVTIPAFQQYISVNPTANISSGSPNINGITNSNLLYVGLEISNANFPAGTTVLSVDYGANTAVLSNNSTGTATGTTLTVVFPDGFYYCPGSTYIDINGQYNNSDIQEEFQIVNVASDVVSGIILTGVFNLWKITHVTYRSSDITTLSFYVQFDEKASYSSFNRFPTDAVGNAITQQTTYRSYGWNIAENLGYTFQEGSSVARGNLDAQNISDYVPVIIGQTGHQINGAWYVGFTGSGVTVTETGDQYNTVTVTIPASSGATGATGSSGTSGATGATGATGSSGTSGATGATGATGTAGSSGTSGSSGTRGATGATGTAGSSGTSGSSGTRGATGTAGSSGTSGGGGSALAIYNGGSLLTTAATQLDFTGAGVTSTVSSCAVTVCIPGGGGSSIMVVGEGKGSTLRCGNGNSAVAEYSGALSGVENSAIGQYSTITGGAGNSIAKDSCQSFVGGGTKNLICSNHNSLIGGGDSNQIICGYIAKAQGTGSLITGGTNNTIKCNLNSSIVGGEFNSIGLTGEGKGGGWGEHNFIGGGLCNTIYEGCSETRAGNFIGGGLCNNIGLYSSSNSILGGLTNTISQYSSYNSILGGGGNTICEYGSSNSILGGEKNTISQCGSLNSILGGSDNTICECLCNVHVIGTCITADTCNMTYVNDLCCYGGGLSDKRLKSNIRAIPYTLCQISSLNPVSFTFNDDGSQTTKYGFIAQEVQEILPELVSDHPYKRIEDSPALRLEKDGILMGSISAIKEISAELDGIKETLDQIKQIQLNLDEINKRLGIDPTTL